MVGWWSRFLIVVACALVWWLITGCSQSDTKSKDEDSTKLEAVDVLYNRAADSLAARNYKKASEEFEEVERQHPYSDWATRAQVMAAYASYRDQNFSGAQAILERFVKLHPNNPSTPYAYYLRALTFYDQITDVGRDQKMTEDARQSLKDVVSRYPNTDYARDAKLKLDLTEDHLAGKEMQIGRYYQQREEFLAAVNRFKFVVDHYQNTSHVPEALHRLVETYLSLGVKEEAKKYAAVLGYNYPGSEWYQYSYAMLHGDVHPEKKDKPEGFFERAIPSL